MTIAFPFLPVDRLHALAHGGEGEALPDRVCGAALLADVWGFTILADALANAFGPQRGAEELTRHLNLVYGALIGAVDRFGGSVLGFSGDAITCWFAAGSASDRKQGLVEASRRAVTCAVAMQEAVRAFARIEVAGSSAGAVSIAPKVAVAAGDARRFRVGDGAIQYLDALAGSTLDRLAATERRAARGEVLLEHATALALGDAIAVREWRGGTGALEESAVIERVVRPAPASPWPPLASSAVNEGQLRPWLLPAVYERLVSGQGEFLAELRPAVAVFVRFGGIDYDADDAAGEKLDRYVRWVQGVLARYGGTLIDLTFGDKGSYFYAAFGAPTAHEDDAARALHAALQLRALPADLRFLSGVQIGISRGRTRAGPIGGPSRRAYTVTGSEVNVAARLMQAAAPGEILVSAHVLEGEGDAFTVRTLAPMAIKGRTELVRAVALEGTKERASQEPAGDGTSMVGRERELALVTAKMELAARGSGQIVAITAEAGIGKSRLLGAVVRAAKERGFAVHAGEAQSFGTIATYLAWHGVWRGVLEVDGSAPADAQRSALEAALTRIDPTLVPRLPLLGPVVGIAIADNELTRQFEAKLRKDSLEALLATCLRAASARGPTLVAIEDAHWMDPLSIELLESVARAIAGMSVLLVLTSRPHDEERRATARIAPLPHFAALPLGELTRADSAILITRVVRARLGAGAEVSERFIELLHARAEGNPFLAEELVEFLLDRGISPAQADGLEATELPANLASAILGRIDRLTTTQQTTLRIASVIGRAYRFAWLWGVHPELGVPARVREDLDALAKRDLTSLEAGHGDEADETYVFKHSMVQEVAYGSLPFAMRAKLHEQLAEWLEERGEASVDLLAFHFGRSKNAEKQREYFRKAGDAAAGRYANEAAAEYYERLVEVVSREEQPAVLLSLGTAKAQVSRWEDAERAYRRALALIEHDPPHGLRARVRMAMAATHTQRAAYDEALRWLADAAADFSHIGDQEGEAGVLIETANTYRLQGKLDEALQVLEGLQLEGRPALLGRAYHVRGATVIDKPDLATASDWWKKSLEIRRELADKPGIATLLINTALAAFFLRRNDEARALLAEGQRLCHELGMRWESSRANHLLALILANHGDIKAARALFLQNYVLLRELGALRELAELMVSMILTWQVGPQPEGSIYVLRLSGAGSRLSEEVGSRIPAFLQAHIDDCLAKITASLGAETAERARSEGRLMPWGDAVDYAIRSSR